MLDQRTREIVKATAPVLREHGVALSRHFYARMFEHNPELKPMFNQGHQRAGSQQQALAMAVAAYAENIDDPSVLAPVLERVIHKHASLGIRPEHYAIVGQHLLASIREVLGAEAANEALINAWAQAYGQLADILIGLEQKLYQQATSQPGGWSGWRGFRVVSKVAESEEITSFYLAPADGGPVPAYKPGQYISVRVYVPELGYQQPRQYSLSAAPGGEHLRISVKRESAAEARAAGLVSNTLHNRIHQGDVIDVAPPMGDFTLHTDRDTPVVLISGGVGTTPMVSMLDFLVSQQPARQVRFIHACRHGGVHAFRDHVAKVAGANPQVKAVIHYDSAPPQDAQGATQDRTGFIDLAGLRDTIQLPDADYYICGPAPFMRQQISALGTLGIPADRIHAEAFGTGGV